VGWSLGNSWRIAGDVNRWDSVYNAIRTNENLYNYSRPGGWNDPDMLVGSAPTAAAHLETFQSRTQFSMWAVMAAPLLIGSNMLHMPPFDVETYTNPEVIAIDQDPLGYQGRPIINNCGEHDKEEFERQVQHRNYTVPSCQQVWAKKLSTGGVAVNMINFSSNKTTVTCDASCIAATGLSGSVHVRDVWQHKDLGTFTSYSAALNGDGDSVTVILTQA